MRNTIRIFGILAFMFIVIINIAYAVDVSHLMYYYECENTASVVMDSAGVYNKNLTITGTITNPAGKIGNACSISSSPVYAKNSGMTNSTAYRTFDAWVRREGSGNQWVWMVQNGIWGSNQLAYQYPSTVYNATSYNAKSGSWMGTVAKKSNESLVLNNWEYWVWVYKDDEMTIYRNGNLVFNDTNVNIDVGMVMAGFSMGVRYDNNGENFNGKIDNFAIWDTSWDIDDVVWGYNSGTGRNYSAPASGLSIDWDTYAPANNSDHSSVSVPSTLTFYYNITDYDEDLINCTLYEDGAGVSYVSFNVSASGQYRYINRVFYSEVNYTSFRYELICNDIDESVSSGNKTINVLIDTQNPTIADYIPSYVEMGTEVVEYSSNMSDYNLYSYNVSLLNSSGYVMEGTTATGVTPPTQNLSKTTNISNSSFFTEDNYTVYTRVCDGHTKQHIDEWEDIGKSDGSIIFGNCRIYPDTVHIGDYGYRYEDDRYVWWYEWTGNLDTTRSYFLECPNTDLVYMNGSEYKGHFIDNDKERWTDFETEEGYDVTVARLTATKYRITYHDVPEDVTTITTQSIGELNCITHNLTMELLNENPQINRTLSDTVLIENGVDTLTITWNVSDLNLDNVSVLYYSWENTTIFNSTAVAGNTTIATEYILQGTYHLNITAWDTEGGYNTTYDTVVVNPYSISFSTGVCPGNTESVLMMGILVMISLFFIVFGEVKKTGIWMFFGGVLLMILGWSIVGCQASYGTVLLGISVLVMAYGLVVLPNKTIG